MLATTRVMRQLAAAVLASATVFSTAYADPTPPDAFIKNVTNEVMDAVKSDKDIHRGNVQKINHFVEERVLPYVDFQRMTASAVGRSWRTATPAQQQQIIDQFKTLLVYTYAGAISEIGDQTIQFLPMRDSVDQQYVTVNTQVINPSRGGEPVPLSYKLEHAGDSWKIVDVNVLGVWLVQNYRSSFAEEINKGGIDGLIASLKQKNDQLANGAANKGKS